MNKEQLEKLKEKGFNIELYAHKVSKMYLHVCLLEYGYNDFVDYCKKFGIGNEFRNDIITLNRNTNSFIEKVKKYISEDATLKIMQDFEMLDDSLEEILNALEKNFYKSERYK